MLFALPVLSLLNSYSTNNSKNSSKNNNKTNNKKKQREQQQATLFPLLSPEQPRTKTERSRYSFAKALTKNNTVEKTIT